MSHERGDTNLPIMKTTKQLLEPLKRDGETWDSLIQRILREREELSKELEKYRKEEREETIVYIPEDQQLDNTMVEAIEEVKPPSKWMDLVKFTALGIMAGTGLGVVIPW